VRKSLGLAGIIQGINDLLLRFAMSDSRKGIKVEFRTQRFPTVKLTKSLMSELLDVAYDEYEKLQEAKASFWILVTDKKSRQSICFLS
jgi:hypothetical protein